MHNDERDHDRRTAVDAADDTGLVREQEELTTAQILEHLPDVPGGESHG